MKTARVGSRIRHLMDDQDISFDDLSQRTGLEPSFIKQIVQDDVYPSLGPLLKIARALSVRMGAFLDDRTSEDPLIIRRKDRKNRLSILETRDVASSLKFYSLGVGKNDRHMEPFFVELLPETSTERPLSSHDGEEFIVVYSGQVEIVFGEDTYNLEAGDSIYYNSNIPHYVRCCGSMVASIYAVLYIPS